MATTSLNESDIDRVLLSLASAQWRKVAMLIAQTVEALGPVANEKHDVVAARIRALIDDRALVAQGDISRWRHSEVRLTPTPNAQPES